MIRNFIIRLFLILTLSYVSNCNINASQQATIEKQVWEKYTAQVDYTETFKEPKPKEPKKKKPVQSKTLSSKLGRVLWRVLFVIIAVILAVLIVLVLTNSNLLDRYIKPKEKNQETPENLDENIHVLDFKALLEKAKANNDYKLAIRLYYLQIIKVLSDYELIIWKREKTNNQYINEMDNTKEASLFRTITRKYEQIWFGSSALEADSFLMIEPHYLSFINNIPNIEKI